MQVLNGLFRALDFAKLELPQVMGLVEDRERQAARKALEMFPDGQIPKRYTVNV
jgi:hypothetical protein